MIRTQFDPDEYWQTLEPAYYGQHLYGCALTWEWTRRWTPSSQSSASSPSTPQKQTTIHDTIHSLIEQAMHGPVRSYVSILPTYWYYLGCRYLFRWVELLWPFWALFCSLASWFHGYALSRTYANSFETVCLLVGLFGDPSVRQTFHRPQKKLAFVLGGLSACVRFTTLAAWIPLGLIISFRSGFNYKSMIDTLFGICAMYGAAGVVIGCIIDRYFYGFWAIPLLGNFHFNVVLGNGSLYGTHPAFWYIYAGLPAICGAMLPFFILEVMHRDYTNPNTSGRMILLWIIVPYTLLHSLSAHKEFRFLLPILPLICILVGHAIFQLTNDTDADVDGNNTSKEPDSTKSVPIHLVVVGMILLNVPHLIYLSVIHQRGPIALNQLLASVINEVSRDKTDGLYSVHYLMGCHSAPVYSHLHIPNISVSAWHLDCSPECRSDSEAVCECDAFSADPLSFIKTVYVGRRDINVCIGDDLSSCSGGLGTTETPTFVALMQDDASKIDNQLSSVLGMSHIASIRHTVKYLSWHDRQPCTHSPRCHDVVSLFSLVDIHFDHIEVYQLFPISN
ncbi:dolichyl-phosphate-mannose-glycolipid alpha-mannosyltransferase [Thalassiosira pseudonana CCMP1335]|uniref:Mannosyltransferase n=1 Tax=Thalassiosira pseudonana TaxID=35128 RepID=B8C645_THAPS|nr:dolichyl-phosphate-mannose-glycolipid alpha-mannosyltransferase [Thalassiosira pseudonana CCMP1335]EED91619.1 dolichyl-phosphate-mannose-glycolipid alpha-mannosyltransferase [Thalassiosira pseudonana CCMP1335]